MIFFKKDRNYYRLTDSNAVGFLLENLDRVFFKYKKDSKYRPAGDLKNGRIGVEKINIVLTKRYDPSYTWSHTRIASRVEEFYCKTNYIRGTIKGIYLTLKEE